MIVLYRYTLKLGQKACDTLSILKKLALQKKLQMFVTHNVFLDKKLKHNNNKTNNQT